MLLKGALGSLLVWVIVALPTPVIAADETDIVLAEGPGREQVQAACSMCHSLDYIVMNSPFQDKAGWEKSVKKMITVMGAPLTATDVAAIVDYLDDYYGVQSH